MIQSLTDGPFCTRVTEPRIQILFVSAIHEVLVAERGFIVSLNVRVQHVNVSIEIDWADTTGAHEKVFCIVHHFIALGFICAGLDGGNQDIIGLSPGAVFYLNVIAPLGKINAVNLQVGSVAFTQLDVVVTGNRSPQIQEGDWVRIVSNPTISGKTVVSVLTGVQEGVPFLVFQLDVNAYGSKSALNVFADCLVAFICVVQVSNAWEVRKLLGSFIIGVVLLQGFNSRSKVGVKCAFCGVEVTGIFGGNGGAGILIEFGAIRFGNAHGYEGRSRNLTCLCNVVYNVVAVKQKADSAPDFFLRTFFFISSAGEVRKQILVDVPASVVSSDLTGYMVFILVILLQVGNFVGRNGVNQLPV